MATKNKTKAELEAEKEVAEIDKFIKKIQDKHYFWGGLLLKRILLAAANDEYNSQIDDMLFELELETGYKAVKLNNLAAQMRFEQFQAELEANPYKLNLQQAFLTL